MIKKIAYPSLRLNLLTSQILGSLLFLYQSPALLAEPNINEDAPWTLWAKPRICVMPSDYMTCTMETDLLWLGKDEDNICLLSSQTQAILHCWSNASKGQITQNIDSDKQITYWLTREGESTPLVKTVIRIVSFPKKRIRRRRRHVWSLL